MVVNSYISNSKSMNKFIKFAGYLLSVAVLFFAIDFAAGYVFDHFLFLKNDAKLKYVYEGGGGHEIIVLGASRASHHYVPSVLKEELGMTCYNYGMDGRNIFNQYVVANRLLKDATKKPRLAIMDVSYIDIDDTPGWNGEKLSNLYQSYKIDENVREIVKKESCVKSYALLLSNFYRYNSLLLALIGNSISPQNVDNTLNGYIPLYAEWEKEIDYINGEKVPSTYPLKEEYFRKLLSKFKEFEIKVIVYVSPDYELYSNPSGWEDRIAAICKDYEVPFIDHSHDSLFMEHKDWFNEPFHLNDKGAKKYTSIVAKEIKDYIEKN